MEEDLDIDLGDNYKIRIRATDSDGEIRDEDLNIVFTNSPPTIHSVPPPVDVLETQMTSFLLSSISATDIDPGDPTAYSLIAAPPGPFSVDNNGKYQRCILSHVK